MDVLQSARVRVDGVLNTINGLKHRTFPQEDSLSAIVAIERIFSAHKSTLSSLGPHDAERVVANHCNAVLGQMFTLLPVLGFLHRSKNPKNAFEVYRPLRRLASLLISPQPHLVLSSEWDYSPYTYFQMPELPRYALIGLPASESTNVLLTPVAGHEFGHSIWANEHGAVTYESDLNNVITQAIGAGWGEFQKHFPTVPSVGALTDLKLALNTWAPALNWSLLQCEELFCDLVGLRVFGASYLHAFAFLLAPGMASWPREPRYPTVRQRVQYMVVAASVFGVPVPTDYEGMFEADKTLDASVQSYLIGLADVGTAAMVSKLISHVDSYVSNKGFKLVEEDALAVLGAIRRLVPHPTPASLPAVVNGGWLAAHDRELWTKYPQVLPRRNVVLNELLLKTCEVLEIRALLGAS